MKTLTSSAPAEFAPPLPRQRLARDAGRVLVLNATYEPINVCSVRRAAVLLLKEKAEMVEHGISELRSERRVLARPVVIRLRNYVKLPRDSSKRKITRRAVFARDGWACQYCGTRSKLTVDHVIPRSKGGRTSWENIVAACSPCNLRKGGRLAHDIGMHPSHRPHRPTTFQLQEQGRKFPPNHLHDTWLDYLYWDVELET